MSQLPKTPPPEYEVIINEQVKSPLQLELTPEPPCAAAVQLYAQILRLNQKDEVIDLPDSPPPEYSALVTRPDSENSSDDLSQDRDPWNLPEIDEQEGTKWADLTVCCKVKRVLLIFSKLICLLVLLYLFICSLDFLSSGFRLLGGKLAGGAFSNNRLIQNPVAGLMIGILATVLVQSSSTSTSIIVTMVASGMFDVRPAIPIIMGANIGTSVTNTIVSMAQSGDRDEFRRAFGGATVHDMFNFLSVIILLPLEVASGYLYHLTMALVSTYNLNSMRGTKQDLLKKLTKPFTNLVVQLDKKVIEKIATGDSSYGNKSLIKTWCSYETVYVIENRTVDDVSVTVNGSATPMIYSANITALVNVTKKVGSDRCVFLFNNTGMSDTLIGVLLLTISLVMLCSCLVLMVKLLHSMLRGQIAGVIKKTINADFPGKLSFLTGYVAILVGAGMTILVQSSSIFTSAMTPLVGMGVISLERMYPLTLGSNIGTTATGLLAAMASSGDKLAPAIQIAMCHLFFNISGILLFYPVPVLRKIPISLAKKMGNTTAKYRWFALFYLACAFFFVPGVIFGLSMAGPIVCFSVLGPIAAFLIAIVIINILQKKRPLCLPHKLRNWDFLPLCLHSLKPMDSIAVKILLAFKRCCPTCCNKPKPKHQPRRRDSSSTTRSLLNSSANSSTEPTPYPSRTVSRVPSRAPSTMFLGSSTAV